MQSSRRLLTVAAAGGVLCAAVAFAAVQTQPDGLPAHPLDEVFPTSYPYPLQDLVLQTGAGNGANTMNLVGDGNTLHVIYLNNGNPANSFADQTGQGAFGTAFQLEPNGDKYLEGTPVALPNRPDWTIAFWIRSLTPFDGTSSQLISTNNLEIGTKDDLQNSGAGINVTTMQGTTLTKGTVAINDGDWHHVALVYANDVTCLSVFVDGGLDGRRCNLGVPLTTLDFWGNSFEGFVDQVFVYRRALSETELSLVRARGDAGLARVYPPLTPDQLATDKAVYVQLAAGHPVSEDITPTGQATVAGIKALRLRDGDRVHGSQQNPDDLWEHNGFTVAGWIQVPAGTSMGTYDETLLKLLSPAGTTELYVQNGLLAATIAGYPSGQDSLTQAQSATTARLEPGRWQFVAFTYGASGARLYIDGFLVGQKQAIYAKVLKTASPNGLGFQLGGVDSGTPGGVDIAWLAQFVTDLSPSRLEALRHTGAASWIVGPTTEQRAGPTGATQTEPVDLGGTERTLADGSHHGLAFFYPDGTTPASGSMTLSATGSGAQAVGFDGSDGPLVDEPFSVFARFEAGLSQTPTTLPFASRRASWAARDAAVRATLTCGEGEASSSSAPTTCRARVVGFGSHQTAGYPDACVTSAANTPAPLTCPEGSVIGGFVDGAAHAVGQCAGGFAPDAAFPASGCLNCGGVFDSFDFDTLCEGKKSCDVQPFEDPDPRHICANLSLGMRASCVAGQERNFCGMQPASNVTATLPTFSCPAGEVFQRIDVAGFGSVASGDCSTGGPVLNGWHNTTPCTVGANAYDDLTAQARASCLGQATCTLTGSTASVVTPPGGVSNYTHSFLLGVCGAPPGGASGGGGAATTGGDTPECQAVPDGHGISFTCPAGQKISQIKSAYYGTPGGSCSAGYTQGSCNASGVLDKVKARCLGQSSCSFAPGFNEFGDPCGGVAKTFDIDAVCSSGSTSTPACFTEPPSNNGPLVMTCPDGQNFVAVDDALYGTGTGACDPSKSLVHSTCDATNVKQQVADACVGRHTCTIAPLSKFGDPCPGVGKNFTARLECQTPPEASPDVCLSVGDEQSGTLSCPPGETIATIDFAQYDEKLGSCSAPTAGSCSSQQTHPDPRAAAQNVERIVAARCLGQPSCSFQAPVTEFGDTCPNRAKTFLVHGTCGTRAPRVWLSEPFPAPTSSGDRAIALSWDGAEPWLAVDGQVRSFSIDPDELDYLPSSTPPVTNLTTFVGPAGASPSSSQMTFDELRVYGRALSNADLAALTGTCDTLGCAADERTCVDRSTYSGARPITAQCGGCTDPYWSVTGTPDEECLADLPFMAPCASNSQCSVACDAARCSSTDRDFVARQCEAYGRSVLADGEVCGGCLPDFVTGPAPGDTHCYWSPSRPTGAVCTADAQCVSGSCASDHALGYSTQTVTNRCATTSSEQSLTLSCPAGGRISEIYAADYGQPTSNTPNLDCSTMPTWQQPGWTPSPDCDATGVLTKVKQSCEGQTSCTIGVPFQTFGDPCPNVPKSFVVGYRCAQPGLSSTENLATCRSKDGADCNAENRQYSLQPYTQVGTDYQKYKPAGTSAQCASCADPGCDVTVTCPSYECGACDAGYHTSYDLLSPTACQWAAGVRDRADVSSYLNPTSFQRPPTLAFLKAVYGLAGQPASTTDDLANDGVGPVYLGIAQMPDGPSKTARFRALTAGSLDASLGNCDKAGSPFENPVQNGVVCTLTRQELGATCPPPEVAAHDPNVDANLTCKSGFCSPDHVCDVSEQEISRANAQNRSDDSSQAGGQNAVGDVAGATQNKSVIDVHQVSAPASSNACPSADDVVELRNQEGEQASLIGNDTIGVFDLQLNARHSPGGSMQTHANLTVLGFPIAYDPQPAAHCDNLIDLNNTDCSAVPSPSQLGQLSAPTLQLCIPETDRTGEKNAFGKAIESATYTTEPPIEVLGIPITIEIGPLVDLCAGLMIAHDPDDSDMSAFAKVNGSFAVGLDAKGGIGAESGPFGFFMGLRSALALVTIEPDYKNTVSVEEPTGAGTNAKAYKITQGNKFDLELKILDLGLSLFVEIKAWIFNWSVEKQLLEINGFKKDWDWPVGSSTTYYTPCFVPEK